MIYVSSRVYSERLEAALEDLARNVEAYRKVAEPPELHEAECRTCGIRATGNEERDVREERVLIRFDGGRGGL